MIAPSQKRIVIAFVNFVTLLAFSLSHAEVPAPITSSGLNTQVSGPIAVGGKTQFNITGGTRPGGATGTNLFHSFGDFNVPTNNIANFLNAGSSDLAGNPLPAGLSTSNILGRVTAGNPSVIFGMIQTNGLGGFGNANLFLMNPAGFLFGPNATLHVGGMVAFTTADYLRFQGTETLFNSASNPESLSPLLITPVAAFGFLGSNPAAIAVQGSTLTVAIGQSIALVGGNKGFTYTDPDTGLTAPTPVPDEITIAGGKLLAPGGQINIASFAGAGEISAVDFMPTPGMAMGNITLSQGATLDVSGNTAGTVRIRGGQFELLNSSVNADTGEANGAETAIDVGVTGDLSISSDSVSAFTARALGSGNAGEIRLDSAKMDVNFAFPEFGVVMDSSTLGSGNAGKVTVTTGDLNAVNTGSGSFIESGTGGTGNGGNVTIKVRNGDFLGATINTGDSLFLGTGSAGNLYIGGINGKAESLSFETNNLTTEAFGAKGGSITLEGREIVIKNDTFVSSISLLGENPITINADRLSMDTLIRVQAQTRGSRNGGDIVFTGKRLEMSNESAFITNTLDDGNAGNIRVNASEYVRFADKPLVPTPSGLFTNSIGSEGVSTSGNAGSIHVTTPRLEMTGGARISTTTQTAGRGGDVTVTASEGVFISGQRIGGPLENFGLGGSDGSGVFTRTIGTKQCGVACGRGGDQVITTGRLILQNGGILDSGTTGDGNGGEILVIASKDIVLSGTLNDGTPSGIFSRTIGSTPDAGTGGNIVLTAGQSMTISNGASVSASSTGLGNAGNISINAGQQFEMRDSAIKTEATKASGGNIDIQAVDRVRLVNSSISTSVPNGTGNGGNITIDPNVVALQNSQIIAQAVQGAGGNITLTTPLFLRDSTSLVSASSQFGVNGTVTIQSPTSNLSESLGTLPSNPSQAHSLLTQRCAALANGQTSSFVVAGREQLPADPGGWLTSSLAFAAWGESLDAGHAIASTPAVMAMATDDTGTVSIRRFTPAGFLMANFADSAATGCHS